MTLIEIADSLIIISSVLWFVHLIPQIMKTVKTKDVNGLSFLFYIMSTIAYLMFIFGVGIKGDYVVVFSQLPAYLCNIIMMVLVLKYRKKKEKHVPFTEGEKLRLKELMTEQIDFTDNGKWASIKHNMVNSVYDDVIPTPKEVEEMEEPPMLMLLYKLGYKILKEKK